MISDSIHKSKDTLPTLLTIGQVAETLQISTKTVRRWVEGGDLIAHRIGRQWRISEADLQAFIRMRRVA
jgi:excisionase family DNA binding protein